VSINLLAKWCSAILASTSVVFIVALVIIARSPQVRAYVVPPDGYRVGGTLDLDRTLLAKSPYTLALFWRSTCLACQNSVSSYRTLIERTTKVGNTQPVLVTVEATSEAHRDLETLGLPSSQLRTVSLEQVRNVSVPLLVLLDHTGRILFLHSGPPEAETTHEVLQIIQRSIRTS
jgi:hypothetical protein